MLGTVLYMHRGTPYVYQGGEIGTTNMPFTSWGDFQDIQTVNFFRQALQREAVTDGLFSKVAATTRHNARTPMQWTARRRGIHLRCPVAARQSEYQRDQRGQGTVG